MDVVQSLDEIGPGAPSVVTVGVFDGVHVGHQTIMRIVVKDAAKLSARSVAITFDRNPLELIRPSRYVKYITTLPQKLELIAEQGIQTAVVLPLSQHIIDMTGEEFISEVLCSRLAAVRLVVGTDFAFGNKLSGNVQLLRGLGPQYGFDVIEVEPVHVGEMRVSSTTVRRLLANGQIEMASSLMKHPFVMTGSVVAGAQLGRTIGFPTANLSLVENQVVPRSGVYAVTVNMGGETLPGVVNIGFRPTVQGENETIELHIIGFSGDLYGQELNVAFHHRLRDETCFPDLESLKKQIKADVDAALSRLCSANGREAGD